MPVLRALLSFPLRPAEATLVLEGRLPALLAPLVPAVGLCAYLLMRDCAAADAAATGAALLALCVGAGLGGAAALYPAMLITGASFRIRDRLAPCLVFAAWTALLGLGVVLLLKLFGVGAEAALLSAMIVLVWAAAVGTTLVDTMDRAEGPEGGRALVASCIGLAGALCGLWAALFAVQDQLVMVVPAAVAGPGFESGDPLLVRRGKDASKEPGAVVLLERRGTREAALGRVGPGGRIQPLGDVDKTTWMLRDWDATGRVFFKFGGTGGGSAVRAPPP